MLSPCYSLVNIRDAGSEVASLTIGAYGGQNGDYRKIALLIQHKWTGIDMSL